MDFKKNQEVILKIDDLGNNGEGIGHVLHAHSAHGALPHVHAAQRERQILRARPEVSELREEERRPAAVLRKML